MMGVPFTQCANKSIMGSISNEYTASKSREERTWLKSVEVNPSG